MGEHPPTEAVAAATCYRVVRGEGIPEVPCMKGAHAVHPECALRALVTDPAVRAALVPIADERLLEDDHIPGFAVRAERMVSAILAALAPPEPT